MKFKDAFCRKLNETPPLGIRIQPDLQAVGFLMNILQYSHPATPPWILLRPHIYYTLHCSLKDDTLPEIYRNKFCKICDHYMQMAPFHAGDDGDDD